ncbi:hypothetical protein Slin15195_G102490 [Septoria linicola]|uniref:Uncharacterized protein n=1 Tax=Septoria linicola TaxID=215465 RepID=A0A9Q9AXG9_9PEZI|nr:hypothetical protein Slin14017_G065490 [Septoria linicola]USW56930.1 hypothetical protein Slin15195_G102490 [Septoria linicola]
MASQALPTLIEAAAYYGSGTQTLSRGEEILCDAGLGEYPNESPIQAKLIVAYNAHISAGKIDVAKEIWSVDILEYGVAAWRADKWNSSCPMTKSIRSIMTDAILSNEEELLREPIFWSIMQQHPQIGIDLEQRSYGDYAAVMPAFQDLRRAHGAKEPSGSSLMWVQGGFRGTD